MAASRTVNYLYNEASQQMPVGLSGRRSPDFNQRVSHSQ